MQRLNISQASAEQFHDIIASMEVGYEQPCPGSNLKTYDDVQWLGFIDARILWGHPDPDSFYVYAPDFIGEGYGVLDVRYITDRAPVDENEPPFPIYPEEQVTALRRFGAPIAPDAAKLALNPHEVKRALQKLIKSLPKDAQKTARAFVKKHRSDIQLEEQG
jgi:hypothetical protein